MAKKNAANENEQAPSEVTPEQAQKEKKAAEAKAMRESLNKAKTTLFNFISTDSFKDLTEDVQEAIKRLAKKAATKVGKNTMAGFLSGLFPEVGTEVDEFELFKAERIGRAEMRKKVHYALKKAAPAEKMWIKFYEDKEAWVLDAVGPDAPEHWTKADLPVTRG